MAAATGLSPRAISRSLPRAWRVAFKSEKVRNGPVLRKMANELHRPNTAGTVLTGQQGKGLVLYLVMLYLFLDLVRPAFVWHFPKIIAVILVIAWIMKAGKVKSTQIVCFVLFVAILAID